MVANQTSILNVQKYFAACHQPFVSAQVTDGETVQNKAFEYAFGVLHARGFADQEDAHSKWNCFKKAVSRSNLSMALLRLTLICNLSSINNFTFVISDAVFRISKNEHLGSIFKFSYAHLIVRQL